MDVSFKGITYKIIVIVSPVLYCSGLVYGSIGEHGNSHPDLGRITKGIWNCRAMLGSVARCKVGHNCLYTVHMSIFTVLYLL